MGGLSRDLEASLWRRYNRECVVPCAVSAACRRAYSREVVPEIAKVAHGMGRLWRTFLTDSHVMVGVSKRMDESMSELQVRQYVAGVAAKHTFRQDFSPRPVVIREMGTREEFVIENGMQTAARTL